MKAQISAVISVYKPSIERLNRCLAAVLPQIDEVVICSDLDTPSLAGIEFSHKVIFRCLDASNTGYGKKANCGAKHASGDILLFLNDDVYLNPDAVQKCLEEMKEGVGIVTHTLRFPDGKIQYAGKFRLRGEQGFHHTDYRKRNSRYTEPVEQESVCGASMLVRREAFKKVGGFDESYTLFSEDDSLGLSIRKLG